MNEIIITSLVLGCILVGTLLVKTLRSKADTRPNIQIDFDRAKEGEDKLRY